MKKLSAAFFLVAIFIFAFAYSASPLWRGKTLSESEVKKRWGDKSYIASDFKNGSLSQKAAMSYKIMTDKALIGIDVSEVRTKFGAADGFYFIDSYPAYIIQEGKNHSEETWQIVFLLNDKYKVREIIVHKNCCD